MTAPGDKIEFLSTLRSLETGVWVHPVKLDRCAKAGLVTVTDGRIDITRAGLQFLAENAARDANLN